MKGHAMKPPMVRIVLNPHLLTDIQKVALFNEVSAGTCPDDRVWTRRTVVGDMHAVALEGTGIDIRWIVLNGASPDFADRLRDRFAQLDGRR